MKWAAGVAAAGLVALVLMASPALGSYRGRAGRLAFEYYQVYRGDGGIGPSQMSFRMAFAGATGAGITRPAQFGCDAVDARANPRGRRTEVCPFSAFDLAFPGPGLGASWAVDGGPNWSPDGTRLAFSGAQYARDGTRTPAVAGCPACEGIFISARGAAPRLVPVAIAGAQQPAFLAGGRRLVFTGRARADAQPQLYSVRVDGSGLVRLTTDGASEPAPCSDGSIVFVHRGGLWLRSRGGQVRRLTARGALPDCSPDSRTIAFLRGAALYVIDARGTDLRRLARGIDVDGRVSFSPAGGLIALAATSSGPGCGAPAQSTTNWLEIIDLSGRVRDRSMIDVEPCDGSVPTVVPADTGWQPLPRHPVRDPAGSS